MTQRPVGVGTSNITPPPLLKSVNWCLIFTKLMDRGIFSNPLLWKPHKPDHYRVCLLLRHHFTIVKHVQNIKAHVCRS